MRAGLRQRVRNAHSGEWEARLGESSMSRRFASRAIHARLGILIATTAVLSATFHYSRMGEWVAETLPTTLASLEALRGNFKEHLRESSTDIVRLRTKIVTGLSATNGLSSGSSSPPVSTTLLGAPNDASARAVILERPSRVADAAPRDSVGSPVVAAA